MRKQLMEDDDHHQPDEQPLEAVLAQQQQQQQQQHNEHSPLLLSTYGCIEDGAGAAAGAFGGDDDDDDDEEEEEEEDPAEGGLFAKMTKHVKQSLRQSLRSDGALGEAREAIVEEYENVKEALMDHLHEAEDVGEDFFMDMNLVRNLSILPSQRDIEQLKDAVLTPLRRRVHPSERAKDEEEGGGGGGQYEKIEFATTVDAAAAATTATSEQQQQQEGGKPGGGVPLTAYLTLGSAVMALSSIGPFLASQKNVEPTMKIVWRFQGTAMLLAPFMIQSILIEGFPRLTKTQWFVFLMSSASYAVLCVAFAMSINYTSVANATILTNSQSVLLVIAKLLVGSHVVCWESVGVFVAFAGAVLCSRDATQTSQQLTTTHRQVLPWWLSLWGDCLGLISSVGGIGYIVLGKRMRSIMPVLVFMVLNMTVASFLILAFMYAVGQEVSFDRHVDHGVWGWMNLQADRLPLEMLTVIVCNLMGTMGYVRAFKYFSSVIIAVAALMEPVVASFTAVLMHVDVFPGLLGWIGNALVILGTIAVLYPTVESGSRSSSAH